MKIMKIYTKTGDDGKTSIIGKTRISKDDIRIEAYGSVDELNSWLGVIYNEINEKNTSLIKRIQSDLFEIGAELASENNEMNLAKIEPKILEEKIDDLSEKLQPLRSFILPGGSLTASKLHFARTICRRAERRIVSLSKVVDVRDKIIIYMNRLSDYFFVLARYENSISDVAEIKWPLE